MIILEIAESFKTMKQPNPTRPDRDAHWRSLNYNVYSSQLMVFQFGIDIFDSLEIMRCLAT